MNPDARRLLLMFSSILLVAGNAIGEDPRLTVREVQAGELRSELRQGLELEIVNRSEKLEKVKIACELRQELQSLAKADQEIEIPARQRRGFRLSMDRVAGTYQVHYSVLDSKTGKTLSERAFEFESGGPLTVDLWPFYLGKNGVLARCAVDAFGDARSYRWSGRLFNAEGKPMAEIIRETDDPIVNLPLFSRDLPAGHYEAVVEVRNEKDQRLGLRRISFERPQSPSWWKANEGCEPAVPEPWTPVETRKSQVPNAESQMIAKVWGRDYEFGTNSLPLRIHNQGADILAGPMRLESWSAAATRSDWIKDWKVNDSRRDAESVTLESVASLKDYQLQVKTRLEFDGFMLVALTLVPNPNSAPTVEPFCLRIPVRADYATHLTNYRNAPGPGESIPRYVGKVPPEGEHYQSPVMLTTWLGGDRGGLEWSAESSRGWSLANPQEALQVWKEGDTVWFEARFVTKPFALKEARTLTFGLVATPTKPIRNDSAKWRIYDNIQCWHLPYDWAGYESWHPEVTDPERIQNQKAKYQEQHQLGRKVLVNGGWGISEVAPQWPTWALEMVSEPVSATIWDQYDGCYNTPYSEFLVNSFAANARKLGFDGIRFDTVVPWKPCLSEWHGCGWRGDDGELYGTQNLWPQRELLKRIYRIFHGGVIDAGIIYLPVAGPPLMCVESFEDIHEIGEGYYMKSASLKEGYPQERVRVWMTGKPYGFVVQNNIKGQPLSANERIGALLAAGANPRFAYTWSLSPVDYERNSIPAVAIWDAWDWMDLAIAEWHPHWQNKDLISVEPKDKEIYASFHLQRGHKILLVLTNYEKEHLHEVKAQLGLERLGLPSKLYGRDAMTLEPIAVEEGRLTVSILPERYRLVQVSSEAFPFAEEILKARIQKRPAEATDFSDLRLGKNALHNPSFEEWSGDENRDDLDEEIGDEGEEEEASGADQLPGDEKKPSLKKWRDEWAEGALTLKGWLSLRHQVADHAFRDGKIKRCGDYAIRIESGRGFYIIQYLPVQPNTKYAVEAWVKVKGNLGEGKVFIGVEGNLGGSANVVTEDNGQWQRLAGIIETGEEAGLASYQIRLFGKGTLWVDDLGMYPILGTAESREEASP